MTAATTVVMFEAEESDRQTKTIMHLPHSLLPCFLEVLARCKLP